MVYISHSMEEILHLTDQLVVINNGRILGAGHFYDVIKADAVRGVASSMGLENILTVKILGQDIESGHTVVETKGHILLLPLTDKFVVGDRCYISIRSNEIAIAKHRIEHISIQNQIKGRIISSAKNTACVALHVDIGSRLIVDITPKAFAELALVDGGEVHCLMKAQSFAFLGKVG